MSNIQIYEPSKNIVLKDDLDVSITTAKAFPRNIDLVLEDINSYISRDPEIAKSMWYEIPRGDRVIEGASVRLAEIFLSCWGNLRVQSRIKEIGDTYVVAEAIVFDLEKNIAVAKEVRRKIVNKDGIRYSDDLIQYTAQGAISIAIRNALFTVIPRVFIQKAIQYAKEITLKHPSEKKKSIKDLFSEIVKEFSPFKINKENLLKHIKKNENEIIEEDIIYLRGVLNAIKDGELKPQDFLNLKKGESDLI